MKKAILNHTIFLFLFLLFQCNKLIAMDLFPNNAIKTNNCKSPTQLFTQNLSLASVVTFAENANNANMQMYPYNQYNQFYDQQDQSADYAIIDAKKVKPYKCNQCIKSYASKKTLADHKAVHTETKPHACSYCTKTYALKNSLCAHIKIVHENKNTYTCPTCNKIFTVKNNLTQHIKIHKAERLYACEQCDKKYISRGSLTYHIKEKHAKIIPESFTAIESFFNINNTPSQQECFDWEWINNQ